MERHLESVSLRRQPSELPTPSPLIEPHWVTVKLIEPLSHPGSVERGQLNDLS